MKMKKTKVILIGAIEEGKVATNGESRKNQLFLERFRVLFDEVVAIDTINWRKRPWIIFDILWTLVIHREAKIIVSASSLSANALFNFIFFFSSRKDIYYWVVGGALVKFIKQGKCNLKALKKLRKIIVQGETMVRKLNELGLNNAVYVPNSKPIYSILRKKRNTLDFIKFVFLSRVHPDKGIPEIMEACEILNNKGFHKQYCVDFYGAIEDDYKDVFLESVTKYDNVRYNGVLNLTDISGYEKLADYDVMLFPTYWDGEGFPGVVLDAYMAGLPIIATDWNLNKEVITDEKTGYLIPIHDSKVLADKMQHILDKKCDIEKMRNDCQEYVKQFDYRTVLSKELMENLELL